jgi:hypothetical protein
MLIFVSLQMKRRRPFTNGLVSLRFRSHYSLGVVPVPRGDAHQRRGSNTQRVALSRPELSDQVDHLKRNLIVVDRVIRGPSRYWPAR